MEIFKEFTIEAAHRLPNLPVGHKCGRLHGHSFRVAIHVRGSLSDSAGWLVDFADIKKAFQPLHDDLDHSYLNEIDGLDNPTSENLSKWIWRRLKPTLPLLSQVVVRGNMQQRMHLRWRGRKLMEDVQGRRDTREVALDKVGVSGLRYPIVVLDRENQRQHTVATLKMSVNLPHEFKGTHMSRFIEVLNQHRGEITMRTVPSILRDLRTKLDAESAHIHVVFPYFLERRAPVTGASALMDYECSFDAAVNGGKDRFVFGVRVPVTSLCPCSKAISEYGAHNQRGYITIDVQSARDANNNYELIWFEELIAIAEQSASAPVYPLLKRADERHVTMQAFDNPVFVEDMVRNVALALRNDLRVAWFRIHALNQESIHNHSAFADVEWARPELKDVQHVAFAEDACA